MPKAKKNQRGKTPKPKKASPKASPKKAKKAPAKSAKASSKKIKTVASKKKKSPPRKKKDFRSAFMDSLQIKREELKETIERLRMSRKEYDGQLTASDFIDEIDDAQREISAYSQYSLIERKVRELQKVEHLIGRILKEEEFGLCEECGTQIPKERLLIVPEATLCVACQRELERQDSKRSVASKVPPAFGSRKQMTWESSETQEDGDDLTIKYQIASMPGVDIEEAEVESPPDEQDET
ncbi:MAG: TraR/DksA family transcriptional regulator [Desulfobacteraceae bacterium]|jgi:DnaK suppressor protein